MKKIDIGQTVGVLANVGVIAGIIFLAVELTQNQELMRAQTRNEMSRTIIELNTLSMEDRFASLILKGQAGEPLSDVERFQYARWANNWLRYWENVTYQRSMGLFDDEEWNAQRTIMRFRLNNDIGLRDAFCGTRQNYSQTMVAIMDESLETPCQ